MCTNKRAFQAWCHRQLGRVPKYRYPSELNDEKPQLKKTPSILIPKLKIKGPICLLLNGKMSHIILRKSRLLIGSNIKSWYPTVNIVISRNPVISWIYAKTTLYRKQHLWMNVWVIKPKHPSHLLSPLKNRFASRPSKETFAYIR